MEIQKIKSRFGSRCDWCTGDFEHNQNIIIARLDGIDTTLWLHEWCERAYLMNSIGKHSLQ